MFEKITEAEINERSMARVSTTPGRRTAFGEGNMDAEALKLRFDRLGRFIAGRLNEVLEGMADGSLADAIIVPFPGIPGESISIKQYIDNLRNGNGSLIVIKVGDDSIDLDQIAGFVVRTKNELESGEFANKILVKMPDNTPTTIQRMAVVIQHMQQGDLIDVAPGVSIRDFYKAFLNLKEIAKGDPGEKGDPYTLTEEDKAIIVEAVIAALPNGDEVSY